MAATKFFPVPDSIKNKKKVSATQYFSTDAVWYYKAECIFLVMLEFITLFHIWEQF